MRKLVFFALLECKESFENCFGVSMGSNQTDDYCMAFRFEKKDDGSAGDTYVEIKDPAFASYFESVSGNDTVIDFKPEFVTENKKVMHAPDISRANLKAISDMEYWTQFDERCIGCGGCNTVCGTCSCFDTSDIIYEEGKPDGERRRVWSSCMIPNFTETAGGARSRKTQGANMRFKVFHKFYDFAARFGKENMCVGCGRCDMRCPRQISFFDTVNDLTKEIEKLEK
jgi:anaerobic sulfite reductase subunit A